MKNRLTRKYAWILLIVVLVLIAGHGALFYYISSHFALSGIVSSVIILVAVKLILFRNRTLHSSVHRLFRNWPEK